MFGRGSFSGAGVPAIVVLQRPIGTQNWFKHGTPSASRRHATTLLVVVIAVIHFVVIAVPSVDFSF
jgi:hypothetical protein